MNQILFTAENKTHNPLPIQTIVKFFAFSIIALGVIFLGEGAYSLFTREPKVDPSTNISVPKIEFAKDR